ncbi:bacteriocin immunity protein [Marinobacter shengliensis]|uniref:bacteriocin immunity protein n=1 Tax=Marinobacter shengliensis TaxID=1389223 RepID=UPI0035BB3700
MSEGLKLSFSAPIWFRPVFYPENSEDSTPERIVEIVEQWRARNGLPGLKSAE